jgi:hypothetical protein
VLLLSLLHLASSTLDLLLLGLNLGLQARSSCTMVM